MRNDTCPLDRSWICLLAFFFTTQMIGADFNDPNADPNALPDVPAGFQIEVFAQEPLVRQPCSMVFDAKGRLYVGMGPQYRNPEPNTPGDSIMLVLDTDGDGAADHTKTFATGFNAIQGMAWHGRDLWVANAPDLTIVRDLDYDDEADEYVRVYTDLGNLEHGLHGLNWAPDGKLYMSKGNSKGLTQPGRIAPKPFRELWGVTAPEGSPDFPEPQTFRKGEYEHAYHDPADDWGREGGVLRCDDGGHNLEIVARGFRNPWDITFDTGFNWLGTDNDQTTGDRVFMPFYSAHFGWNHPWSAHWSDDFHPPTAPVSGPMFDGSGTGVIFGNSQQFPPHYRRVFFINDWLRKTTFVWRPHWDGALLRPEGGDWEPFVQGGPALFRPTDIEFGPDGALWILGWSSGYGVEYKDGEMSNEGRVFRVSWRAASPARWNTPKRAKPLAEWSLADLLEDFDGPLPVWRIDAQDEIVRRGAKLKDQLVAALESAQLSQGCETWAAWALGRMRTEDRAINDWFSAKATDASVTLNLRVQALRILAHRGRLRSAETEPPLPIIDALRSGEARLRFEAVQAISQLRQDSALPSLLDLLSAEQDSTTFYAGWQTLRRLADQASLKELLADSRGGVRKAALLALLEDNAIKEVEVRALAGDEDAQVREIAQLWLRKSTGEREPLQLRGRPLRAPQPKAAPISLGLALAKNIKARSQADYQLIPGGLLPGAKVYTDRSYNLITVPDTLLGADFIQTANEDDGSAGDEWLTFEALFPVRVHVALDTRAHHVPAWIREGFRRSEARIEADHWTFQIYSGEFPAGRIELGGNTDDNKAGGKGNYIVVLEPLPLLVPAEPTTIDSALNLLENGDRDRGAWLFHARGGAGCFNCHRLEEHGNSFGPDLRGIGARATARHILQSILEPNAIITEGFNLHTVSTADAEYSGMLLEESGLALTLGLPTGERQEISRATITERHSAASSAMPGYDTILKPQFAADIAAYLLSQKVFSDRATNQLPSAVRTPVLKATSPPSQRGFGYTQTAERLLITHAGQPVAEFVFDDRNILRPYFANVHAPGGLKVTRNHPPVPGVDSIDHDLMHPGIWLAFGDINGVDFWRNKGTIQHVRFVGRPSLDEDVIKFATESRLLSDTGHVLCSLTNRVTVASLTNAWMLIWEATFRSDDGDFSFGDQEEMGFGARVATAVTEKNGGLITCSTGRETAKATWGQSADWCDYSGMMQGERVGITLLSHPNNFRPSWWHNRDYGVFVANPFGRAAMTQGQQSTVTVRRGESFHLRFGAVIHSGLPNPAGSAAGWYSEFLAKTQEE